MRKIKVLVVDDAVVVRKIVSDTLMNDPDIEVSGVAANGKIALQRIPQINPDLVTLDVEMPEMNGIETLKNIRADYPSLPVIMFSTLTERGASTTLEALSLGATDYVTKPANVGSVAIAMERIRTELIPKIKTLCAQKVGLKTPSTIPSTKPLPSKTVQKGFSTSKRSKLSLPPSKIDIVTIGVSTGGPNALAELFPTFPADFPVPIVMVQHMPPYFTKLLAERLSTKSKVEVIEASHGMVVKPGKAYIAPGNYHMVLKRDNNQLKIVTNQDPPENSCRPAVDVLFRSVVELFGNKTLAVILTGMGQDGLAGCEEVKDKGGQVIVQDEASSVVWGMPGFVARANLADKILPLNQMGEEINQRSRKGRLTSLTS